MISPQSIQQIEQRTDIVDVLGQFISLKKRGVNYLGLCPFHGEKTPSFTVSPTKQIYKCFGCGRSGSSITFLMEHEKLSYPDSLRWLAEKYGIDLIETHSSNEQKKDKEKSNSLAILNKFASDFFHHALLHTDEGKRIGLTYLKERGFKEETIQRFEIGFSPTSPTHDVFYQAAKSQQFDEELLLMSGLVKKRDNGHFVDSYGGRIIFPIYLVNQKISGFGARKLGEQDVKSPKYINTPQNELYNKSEILYGLNLAKEHIIKQSYAIIVEGYTDVITLAQHGIKNVVASAGTALTKEQLLSLKKLTSKVILFYDNDPAGINASIKGINVIIPLGIDVDILQAPAGEDPDSFVKSYNTASIYLYIQEKKQSFLDFLVSSMIKDENNIQEKSEAINKIAEVLSHFHRIEDQIKRYEYIKHIAKKLDIEADALNRLVNIHIKRSVQQSVSSQETDTTRNASSESGIPAPNNTHSVLPSLPRTRHPKDESYTDATIMEMLRLLMSYGDRVWNINPMQANQILDGKPLDVAGYVFSYLEEMQLDNEITQPTLRQMLDEYKRNWLNGIYLSNQHFLYHPDEKVRAIAVEIGKETEKPNQAWDKLIADFQRESEENYIKAITSALAILTIRLIKKMMYMNEVLGVDDHAVDTQEETIKLETHKYLLNFQKKVAKEIGAVIIK